jgi:tetratricopeptide (TPR) repeat protein
VKHALIAVGAIVILLAGLAYFELAERNKAPAKDAPTPAAVTTAATYVGGKACEGCHAKAYGAWRGSDHDLAMQVADERSVLGNFDNAKLAYAGTTSTFFRRDGRFYVNTDGPDGKRADFAIKYTFGVRPLQQYLIELPGGRLQALSIAWDTRPKAKGGQRWFHLYPGQDIKAGDPLHWTGIQQNWNFQCAECHSTNLQKGFDPATSTFHTTWSEIDVSCEACHGPGSNHLAWAKLDDAGRAKMAGMGLALALDERKGVSWAPVAETGNAKRSAPRQSAREIDMCARCHSRAGRFSDAYAYGEPLGDTHRQALLDEGLYWADGQMRDEVYNWGPYLQSRMYQQGVTCSDCHDPHTLKLRAEGNLVCAQCHQPAKYDTPAHTHHALGTPGAACTACHMPTTTYMQIDPRHDHSLRVPRPDLSAKLGVPNACNNCHAKQSVKWAQDAVLKWYGHEPQGYQRYAVALAAGTIGTPAARGALLTVIQDKSQPAIARATALVRLGRWLTPSLLNTVTLALSDPDPLVRAGALQALEGTEPAVRARYLPRMLTDPVRDVRMAAARALAGEPESALPPEARVPFQKALDEYIAAQMYNADRPEGHASLGNLYAARGDIEQAIAEYRKAIAIDPTFVPAYANLADLYRARGAETDAEAALREGLARNPGSAQLHYALALAMVRQKRGRDATHELAETLRLDPRDPYYAYTAAVALADSGQPVRALQTLQDALVHHPFDRELLSALAYFSANLGNRAAALAYVKRLRELDPENAEYARLAARIEGRQ